MINLTIHELERMSYMFPDNKQLQEAFANRCRDMVEDARLEVYNTRHQVGLMAEIAQDLDDELTELYHDSLGLFRDPALTKQLQEIRLSMLAKFVV
jgi:hypothetical protein